MTGFKLTPAQKQEINEDVNRRTASVTQYLKNLDAQLLLMERKDEDLVTRLKKAQ